MKKGNNPLLTDEFLDEIVQEINQLNSVYADDHEEEEGSERKDE